MSAIRYEWRRLRTLRSTWILSILAIGQAAGFTALLVLAINAMQDYSGSGSANPVPTKFSELIMFMFVPFFPVLLSGIAAQAFGHDYRHGTIRLSLSLFPRRTNLLAARILVLSIFQFVVVSLAIASVIGIVELNSSITGGISTIGLADGIVKLIAYLMVYLWIVISLSIITRIQALAFVIPMILSIIVENIVWAIAGQLPDWEWVINILPYTNATNWITSNLSFVAGLESETSSPLPIIVLWAVLGIWSAISFHKRDA